MKIGVLKETKVPPDRRVALPPRQITELIEKNPSLDIVVQKSDLRCFDDDEYSSLGIKLVDDVSDCDVLIGVKEVAIPSLIPDKTYIFFAHVAKEQQYNRELLRTILDKKIRLMDYEYFTNENGIRLIAFGRWAGIVGAYNGIRGWGLKSGKYIIKPAHECHDRKEMDGQLNHTVLENTKILITGGGRVGMGAVETMKALKVKEVSPDEYLHKQFDEAVYCRLDPCDYVEHKEGREFDLHHFFQNPSEYKSIFKAFTSKTDIYIAAHFWDPESPRMFELDEITDPAFKIGMIADISCDINGSVPSTIRASTIAKPFYGYDPKKQMEAPPFDPVTPLTMMTVDNLPGELPRDASAEFGGILVKEILPRLIDRDPDGVIERATICENGELTEKYSYLQDYVKGVS